MTVNTFNGHIVRTNLKRFLFLALTVGLTISFFVPGKVDQTFGDGDFELIQDISKRWLKAPSMGGKHRYKPVGDPDRSQFGQSRFVDDLLKNKTGGFFVECGAVDGDKYSNTAYFEVVRNWTGLLIEANNLFYRKLLSRNRNAYAINACLSRKNKTGVHLFRPLGLMGAVDGTMDKVHEKYLKASLDFELAVKVQCFPLYSVMLAVGVTHIDYFALDIEGAELDVLKTIPFDKLVIDVISVEYRSWGGQTDYKATFNRLNDFRTFFAGTGFYEEVALLPVANTTDKKTAESLGLDVVFKRIYSD